LNRKYEKQYQKYIASVTSPKTVNGIFYPNGFGEPCSYKRWIKTKKAENVAMSKLGKILK